MDTLKIFNMDYIKEANRLIDLGISCVPLRRDYAKIPMIDWGEYADRLMTKEEVLEYFKNCGGIAAITGKISNLYLLDFDLKKQLPNQDYWKEFTKDIPKSLKKKLLINNSKNNGKHIWVRTDYEAKSTALARRFLTIPELNVKFEELQNKHPEKETYRLTEILLKKPYEVIIETRSRRSYGVIVHPDYSRFYGDTFSWVSNSEIELLNSLALNLDCNHEVIFEREKVKYANDIAEFNRNANSGIVLGLLEESGMFTLSGYCHSGDIKVKRVGSDNPFCGKIYRDTGVFHLFSDNTIFDTSKKSSFSPFEVLMEVKNLDKPSAVKYIKTLKNI